MKRGKGKKVTPATIIYCHKVALAFVGIGHLVVEKTQVDLREAEKEGKKHRSNTGICRHDRK